MDLATFWFVALGVLLTGYAILDGFDLGTGILHLTARTDTERRIQLNAIGPLWDGNEVWLVTFGGALFAAFPAAYAAAFSGFYLPFMALLFGLIFRAVSIEFRSKVKSLRWRSTWDVAFCAASTLTTFLFGVAVGNAMQGMAIDGLGVYRGTTLELLGPFPLAVGLFAVVTFAMHGALYLMLKTEGALQARLGRIAWGSYFAFLALYLALSLYAVARVPSATANFQHWPALWILVALNALAVANIPRALKQGRTAYAFVSSCCTIAALVALFGAALFPNLVVSTLGPAFSLTVDNAASSEATLRTMRTIAFIGLPFVLTYTGIVYWVFRGKVKLDSSSY